MEVYDLENLKTNKRGTISQKCIDRLRSVGIETIYDILDMIENDDYTKLKEASPMPKSLFDKILERAIDLDLPETNPIKDTSKKFINVNISADNKEEPKKEEEVANKESITKYDLSDILNKYIIEMLQSPKIPKLKLSFCNMYPIDTILFGQFEVYIKGDFISNLFNKFIKSHFILKDNDVTDIFKFALVGSKIIQSREVDGQKYQLNRYNITGNRENYILINRTDLDLIAGHKLYIEPCFDPFVDDEFNPKISVNTPIGENSNDDYKIVYSTSNKKIESTKSISNVINTSSSYTIILNSCKPILGSKYMCTFSIISRKGEKYNFDLDMVIGTYQFDINNVSNGKILIEEGHEFDPQKIKSQVLKML